MSFTEKRHCINLTVGAAEALRYLTERKLLIQLNERTISKISRIREALCSGLLTSEAAHQCSLSLRRCYRWNRRAIKAGKLGAEA